MQYIDNSAFNQLLESIVREGLSQINWDTVTQKENETGDQTALSKPTPISLMNQLSNKPLNSIVIYSLEKIIENGLAKIDWDTAMKEEKENIYQMPLSKSMQISMDLLDLCFYLRRTYNNDPIITFYFMYQKNKKLNLPNENGFITIYNEQFNTSYKDSKSFLTENGFASFKEIKNYIIESLELLKASTRRKTL